MRSRVCALEIKRWHNYKRLQFPILLVAFTVICGVGLGHAETRHHGAHVHGLAKLNIALDGNDLLIELTSPAANIIGFEHAPKTEEEIQAIHEAVELLENGEKIFSFSAKAECRLHEAHLESDLASEHHDEERLAGKEHGDQHQEQAEDHSGEEHGHGDVHSEFQVSYHFDCGNPDRLESIEVLLFSAFPGFEEIEVQLLTRKLQTGFELSPQKHKLSF